MNYDKYLHINFEKNYLKINKINNKIKLTIFDLYDILINYFYQTFYFEIFSITIQHLQIYAFPLGITVKYLINFLVFKINRTKNVQSKRNYKCFFINSIM
jgi:hypothetical protein